MLCLICKSLFWAKPANGLRYLRVGGRGFCLGAGKTRSQKMFLEAADSHTSGARFVSPLPIGYQPCFS